MHMKGVEKEANSQMTTQRLRTRDGNYPNYSYPAELWIN